MAEIFKEKKYEGFTVQILSDEHETQSGKKIADFSVVYLAGEKLLERYDCEDYNFAERDYNTVCDAIRNVLNVIRGSLG